MTPASLVAFDRPVLPAAEPDFVAGLRSFGDRTALVAGDVQLTYRELDAAVDDAAARLDGPRRLVAILARRRIDDVVHYLGALRAGLPVLLVPRCRPDAALARYAPDVIVRDGQIVADTRPVLDRDLHSDLAVLLSTSGTTGSPRVVRLSLANLESNAAAVVATLGLTDADRAVTTLEFTYSYGLSVLHSHLAAGAGLVLTELSVTDSAFEDVVRHSGATTMAAVPYTFDLLDRHGTQVLAAPSLRQVTCAGGRLPAPTARRYAELGRRHGFDLVLMYGATEATARMAVLPPHLTASNPGTVGRAIPGGAFRLDDVGDDGVGDLVYSGPNLMLGYAEHPADLARGRDLTEWRTGDRARLTVEGLLEIVGRRAQITKVHGLRVDLADVDRALEEAGLEGVSVALDDALGVAVVGVAAPVATAVASASTGLPPASLRVAVLPALPRLDNGKLDRTATTRAVLAADVARPAPETPSEEQLRRRYEALIGVPVRADQSFADVGGDSLAYVAVSVAVEETLGHLPRDWHRTSVTDLAAALPPGKPSAAPTRLTRQVETSVVVRALAILVVVASHVGMVDIRGGAHLLLALVGFNLARFHLSVADPALRLRRMLRSTGEILVPSFVLLAALALSPFYEWYVLGATSWVIPTTEAPEWRFWFVEALVWVLPLVAVVLRIPWVESLRRGSPWLLPAAATCAVWVASQHLLPDARPASLFSPLAAAWVVLLGWTAAEAHTRRLKLATSLLVVVTVVPSFDASRQWVIPLGLLAILWLPSLRLPSALVPPILRVAQASLYIYLVHWLVLGVLDYGWTALIVSLAAGIVTFHAVRRLQPGVLGMITGAVKAGRRYLSRRAAPLSAVTPKLPAVPARRARPEADRGQRTPVPGAGSAAR